jgi:hypothetical protein
MAHNLKMTRKFGGQPDYPIGKLEGQWWTEDKFFPAWSAESD